MVSSSFARRCPNPGGSVVPGETAFSGKNYLIRKESSGKECCGIRSAVAYADIPGLHKKPIKL